jgi:hypothetical protein
MPLGLSSEEADWSSGFFYKLNKGTILQVSRLSRNDFLSLSSKRCPPLCQLRSNNLLVITYDFLNDKEMELHESVES